MPNLTMSIDANLLLKARKLALNKGKSLNGIIREYLTEITSHEEKSRLQMLEEWHKVIEKTPISTGRKKWNRDDLYDRPVFR